MISVIITFILTALILLICGVNVPTLLAFLITMCGSQLVGRQLKDVESRYSDWKYWVLIAFTLVTTVLLACGLTYKSFWTLVTGGTCAVLAILVKAVFRIVAKHKTVSEDESTDE